jgi:hypothetical protein
MLKLKPPLRLLGRRCYGPRIRGSMPRREMQHRNQRLSLSRASARRALDAARSGTRSRRYAGDVEQLANKVDQLAAKQDQMSQNIAASQAVEQDITEERSSPPLSESVSPPPRKKARRVASRKLTAQSSSSPPPAFTHSDAHPSFFMAIGPSGGVGLSYEPRGVYPTGKALK